MKVRLLDRMCDRCTNKTYNSKRYRCTECGHMVCRACWSKKDKVCLDCYVKERLSG